jgi:DNA-binding beta-propeller fold protein YncE
VIDANKCKPGARCRVIAKARAGKIPLAEVIDRKTDTIYVGDGPGTVTVVDGARCNAEVTRGCGKPLATIKTGGFLVALAFNPKTRTVYAANAGPNGSVFVIDAAKCNADTTKGCGRPVREVKDPLIPDAVAVDRATDTVYAANGGPMGNGHTVSVIDGATCNGSNGSGCGQAPRAVKVGSGAFWDVVDQKTNTVYVANHNDGTVSVINGTRCNAKVSSGCRGAHAAVPTGAGVGFLAVDDSRHTVFALNQDDDTMSAINTKTCNGSVTSGCGKRARNERARVNPPYGYNPNEFALIPRTDTAYLVNVGGEPFLGAISVARCNATDTSRCRLEAPTARDHEFLFSLDRATHTLYAGNAEHPRIDVINTATCHAGHLSGCRPVAHIPMPHPQANLSPVDHKTHTLYASDPFANTISVIDVAHCNAADTSGCAAPAPKLTVGPGPGSPVLDDATHTLYAPEGANDSNQVAVVNIAACHAGHTSGCGQAPATVTVAKGTFVIALSRATDTVYAAGSGFGSPGLGHTVAVINGANCNGHDHSGCGHPVATAKVGLAPFGLAVNDRTHTVYVSNNEDGDLPGTVSLINTATCNGSHTAGCSGHKPTVLVGRSPGLVAVDRIANRIYVGNFASAAVSVINGRACRAGHPQGCAKPAPEQAVGSTPQGIAVDETNHSVYVANVLGPGYLSVFKTSP